MAPRTSFVRTEVTRRRAALALGLAVGGSVAGRLPSAGAQDPATAATAGHPIVGTWLLDPWVDPAVPPGVGIFHADGTFIQADPNGTTEVGRWEATGPATAAVTSLTYWPGETAAAATLLTARATFAVDAAGDTVSGEYTVEIVGPDGTSTGELGPAPVTGERVAVEPMGTPVMTLEEFLAGAAATPAP